eukprot:11900464-Ditylum_brightwellii.AAC.1
MIGETEEFSFATYCHVINGKSEDESTTIEEGMPALLPCNKDDGSSEEEDSTIGGDNNSTVSEDSYFVFEGVHKLESKWNNNSSHDNTDLYSLPE